MPLFNFRLKPLDEIISGWEAFGSDVPKYLSGWYWLTDGWYWFEAPSATFPVSHPDFDAAFGQDASAEPYPDYQIARFMIDMNEIMPNILEPLPEPFATWVSGNAFESWRQVLRAWEPSDSKEVPWEVWHDVSWWWNARHIDLGYFIAPPDIRFTRVEDKIITTWNTRNKRVEGHLCWTESVGAHAMPVSDWQSEWADFVKRMDAAMQQRLGEVAALSILSSEQMASLHEQHARSLVIDKSVAQTDWARVLFNIEQIENASGIKLPRP